VRGPGAAERRARSARARRAVARSDRDGAVRKPFSNRTVAVRRCERPVKCVSCVYLCPVPGPRTLIFRLPGADKHALLELLAALASLLWQRPAHPTHRPARGRPRQAFLPLWPVVWPQNGRHNASLACSEPCCRRCCWWTRGSCTSTCSMAPCSCCCCCHGCLIYLDACRCVVCSCGCCAVQFLSARNAQNLNFGWSTFFCIQPFLWLPATEFRCQLTRQR